MMAMTKRMVTTPIMKTKEIENNLGSNAANRNHVNHDDLLQAMTNIAFAHAHG